MTSPVLFGLKTYVFDRELTQAVKSSITKADNLSPDDDVSGVFWHYLLGGISPEKAALQLSDSNAKVETKAHNCMVEGLEQSGLLTTEASDELKSQFPFEGDIFEVTRKEKESLASLFAPTPEENKGKSIWDRTNPQ